MSEEKERHRNWWGDEIKTTAEVVEAREDGGKMFHLLTGFFGGGDHQHKGTGSPQAETRMSPFFPSFPHHQLTFRGILPLNMKISGIYHNSFENHLTQWSFNISCGIEFLGLVMLSPFHPYDNTVRYVRLRKCSWRKVTQDIWHEPGFELRSHRS